MATREQLRLMQTRQPFQPFTVKMNSGSTFQVTHPELVSCTIDGRSIYLHDNEGTHMLEMLLVEELKVVAKAEQAAGQKNGD